MIPLFAEVSQHVADGGSNWNVVTALGMLATLGANLVLLARMAAGKGGERQIEPTQIHALGAQIGEVARALSAINREIGEVRASLAAMQRDLGSLQKLQHEELIAVHRRIDALSVELAATASRVDGLEKRERS